MQSAIKKLLKFIEHPECQDFLELANESFFNEFAEEHGCEDTYDIEEAIGERAFGMVYPCALEFFFSNDYVKDRHTVKEPWNAVDLFLKQRGAMLALKEKEYLRSLRHSHMSLYEVTNIVPEQSLILRDLIEDKPPVIVPEQALTRHVSQWEIIGARLCMEGGKPKLSGGCLPITRKASTNLIALIRIMHREGMKRTKAGRFGESLQEGAGRRTVIARHVGERNRLCFHDACL